MKYEIWIHNEGYIFILSKIGMHTEFGDFPFFPYLKYSDKKELTKVLKKRKYVYIGNV